MSARTNRAVRRLAAINVSAAALLSALSGQAMAQLDPTVIKFEWTVPGHGYTIVAVHGPLQGVMAPGHFDSIVADPNAVWTNVVNMFTSATPPGAPMFLSVEDWVTHNLSPHGEATFVGPYVVAGVPLGPPPGGFGVSFGATVGGQHHTGGLPTHWDLSDGIVAATYGGAVDVIVAVLYLENGIHDPPPGCTGRVGPCKPSEVVPPSSSTAHGAAAVTINLSDNGFAVGLAVQGITPAEIVSASLHLGKPGEVGPVILAVPGPWQAVGADVSACSIQGFFPSVNVPDLLAGRVYVQIATTSFPLGAVRGQLVAPALYSNSGNLNDPFVVTRAGGQCGIGGDATDLQTTLGLNLYGFGCQAIGPNAVADDFVVPPGQSWKIDGFELNLYQTGATSPTITSIDYAFSETNLFGQAPPVWTTVQVSPAQTTTFKKRDIDPASTECTRRFQAVYVPLAQEYIAGEGQHWFAWRATGSSTLTGPWQAPVVVPGQVQRPGSNAMQSAGGQPFAYLLDTGNQTQQDLVFEFGGFAINQRPPTTWFETGEAGQLPGSAQVVTGSGPLHGIRGQLGASDADMYRINVCNANNFSASTIGGSIDTQLFMFRLNGTGLTHNDDDPANTGLQSVIGNSIVGPAGNGEYFLAISHYNKDPHGAATGGLIWLNTPFNVERAPDGPAAAEAIGSWDAPVIQGGQYLITLTGSCFAAIASCYANCDGSTNVPILTANDFVCFVNKFANSESYANCDGSTSVPILTANDFVCFVNAFAFGCT